MYLSTASYSTLVNVALVASTSVCKDFWCPPP